MNKLSNAIYSLNINYLSKVKYTVFISFLMIAASIYSLSTNWLNLGLDFTGGVTVELEAEKAVDTEAIRRILTEKGFADTQVIQYGTEKSIQVKLPPIAGNENQLASQLQTALADSNYQFKLLGQSLVGPQFGHELIDSGLYALILVLVGIMIYLSVRFQWKLALGAVAALTHDLIITLGFFSFSQIEFDLTVLAALLAVLGYSVNDTVVVFDRIRENFRLRHTENEFSIVNLSINQTMSRTLITSITTLLSVISLAIFGGPILFGFAIALIVGIIVGTYSSIFVASALAMKLKLTKADLTPKKPEEIDDLP
ncbi:MAG: protein translocase subunit SecF [Gammaproteobacteria bacterium]|nr:MAG: protein translocase subunit SecF [Gammaproteobacteria bacterium]